MTMTLGEYRDLAAAIYGEQSGAVKFLEERIASQGRDMQVLADESQMLFLLQAMHVKEFEAG
jgi:hypothetical protein